jgi:hypothetical protein
LEDPQEALDLPHHDPYRDHGLHDHDHGHDYV